ncbi:MAG: endonuclease/exonuclease/phosphatase family protein [Candidatus Algichlamydia australiensis]|nr:endonuclease/exonuclease/phosphatase family protein [Chlamydiales bacterium]
MSVFSYSLNEVEEKTFADELSVLTFNTCALPSVLPKWFGGMPPVNERKEEVVDFIHQQDADLVCLQEVWDPYFRKFLVEELKEEYPHIFTKIGPSCWGMDSGLFIASKYPVIETLYIPYDNNGSIPDRVIHRGVFTFKIGGHKIGVTHLQPGSTKREIRRSQVAQIPEDCEILIGDLNTQDEEELSEFFSNYINSYQGPATHPDDQKMQDYILIQGKQLSQIESYETGCSDHLALKATIKF